MGHDSLGVKQIGFTTGQIWNGMKEKIKPEMPARLWLEEMALRGHHLLRWENQRRKTFGGSDLNHRDNISPDVG